MSFGIVQWLACMVRDVAVRVIEYFDIHMIHGGRCSFWEEDSERRKRAYSRQCDVQLTVTEDVRGQVNANLIKRATL